MGSCDLKLVISTRGGVTSLPYRDCSELLRQATNSGVGHPFHNALPKSQLFIEMRIDSLNSYTFAGGDAVGIPPCSPYTLADLSPPAIM